MKRILLKQIPEQENVKASMTDEQGLPRICDYVTELKLLKDVPLSYLIADAALLPPDSIRFFYVDENWLNALADGALSVGRTARLDAEIDKHYFQLLTKTAATQLAAPRFRRMHSNHRRMQAAAPTLSERRTGLLLRSELVKKWKGLEAYGYCGEKQLDILRMESLSSDIMICIFDGELTSFVISEPKTGLRFGASDHSGTITLRVMKDTDDFGTPIDNVTVNLREFTDDKGKLDAVGLADKMAEKLNDPVESPELAFQLIAVAKRAEFKKGGE